MQNTVPSEKMIEDASEKGPLWDKLQAAANHMTYTRLNSLDQIFLDVKIEEIIRLSYGFTGGKAPSMWGRDILMLAFGVAKTEEE